MGNQVRLFVAIDLPEVVKVEIGRMQKLLKSAQCFEGTYTNMQQAHITMKFIGSVQEDQVEPITKALESIMFLSDSAQLNHVGIFGEGDHIKIVYMNVIAPALYALAAVLDEQLLPWCNPEKRDFVSHVTLVRVKNHVNKDCLDEVLNTLKVEPITFEIQSFVLMQSVLTEVGPEYTTLATFN